MSLHPPEPEAGRAAALAARMAARAAEEGLADVAYATIDSPLGRLVAAGTRRGLVRLAYEDSGDGVDGVLDGLARSISPRIVEAPARLDEARRELDEYFAGRRTDFELAVDWRFVREGFARRVLQATARIPFGRTSTYREIAGRAGSPRGFRAAGNALGANMIPIVVPCHRVLASGGGLGGYTGGLARKEHLLHVEGVLA
ncbi:MAG: methylated-DNA--[protein]-cysteine S-methyltransferase [Solirubrobacterales bacterium]|nr:methylated-DNA--[protein]-cysteine S-methyltransferase [Solirubrobacterales bacterium]